MRRPHDATGSPVRAAARLRLRGADLGGGDAPRAIVCVQLVVAGLVTMIFRV